MIYDVVTLRFLEVNAAAIAEYGYSREEFLALNMRDIRPPADVKQFLQMLRQVDGAGSRGRWRHLRKDGSVLFVLIHSTPITFARRAAHMVVASDASQQQQADEQVRQSEANLALAQRVARMGSWEVDLTDRKNRAQYPPRWSDSKPSAFSVSTRRRR